DRVGELDLAAGPGTRGLEQVEHPRRQHVAADHGERARRILRPRLLDDAGDPAAAPAETLGGDDPVAAGLFAWHFLGGDDAGAAARSAVGHLLERAVAATVPDQVVGQQHREWLVAHHRLRAQYRVSQAERVG